MKQRVPPDFFDLGAPLSKSRTSAPPGASRESAIGISDLNSSTKALLEDSFGWFWVRGEVSDFKRQRGKGHWYFCLRDAMSQISCVVWAGDQYRIPTSPDEGMQVVVFAQMTMFPAQGKAQLRVTRMEAEGDGLWRKAMEETLGRLRADGLLAPERKRAIPIFPRCIAIVTSANGAAVRDIISVASRRRPGIRIVVSCAAVQGEGAPREICAAIRRVRKWKRADVIIVGRGGGASEDLRAFNDESVARAIADCEVPVISAVGHEIDTTVCDLVADLRAATPSAAAERAVPAIADLQAALRARRANLISAVLHRATSAQADLRTTSRDLRVAAIRLVDGRRASVGTVSGKLNALSPLATLSRGYAVARGENGQALTSAGQFVPDQRFDLTLHDGIVGARVERE